MKLITYITAFFQDSLDNAALNDQADADFDFRVDENIEFDAYGNPVYLGGAK